MKKGHKYGPWTFLGRSTKHKSPFGMTLYEDKVAGKDGKKTTFSHVRISEGVNILPLDSEGHVYLEKEFQYAIGRRILTTVSGAVKKGETPLHAAKRELKEELGLRARKWTYLGRYYPTASVLNSPDYFFLAQGISFSRPSPDTNEEIRCVKMRFSELYKKAAKNQIIGLQDTLLIYKARDYLNDKSSDI